MRGIGWIRHIKTAEAFDVVCPDPLGGEGDAIVVRVSDWDLLRLIRSGFRDRGDLDDDSYLGLRALSESRVLSAARMRIARTQAHRRRLGRCATAWCELPERKRAPRTPGSGDPERIAYLRDNFAQIAASCASHGWIDEFILLCRETGRATKRADALALWRSIRGENPSIPGAGEL